MEETKAYIESGILELYVLDQLTDQEKVEVEEMVAKYPEIKLEITAIEIAMEKYALHHAITPSHDLSQQILQQIAPVEYDAAEENPIKNAPTIPFDNHRYESKIRNLKIALAACASLLVVSGITLYSVNQQLGEAQNQLVALLNDKQHLASTVNAIEKSNTDLKRIVRIGNDPAWKAVRLSGTKMDPKANMVVYWNKSGKNVLIDNTAMHLPLNDENHQYQLWALVDGKPVDLGVFDANSNGVELLKDMKEISEAQTFAVTLEKRGGSASPTLDQMIVAGNISI